MTCFGINNQGEFRYDYYHEDRGRNDAVGQQYVYNGYDSVLWHNFSEAFQDDIQKMYSTWRSGDVPLLSYENVLKYFITDQSDKWSISIYNEDAEYKYISMYRNNDKSEFLYQVKGTGEEHLKYFIKNRLMYCDSKWQTGDFVNKDTNTVLLRLNSPEGITDETIKPNMVIKFKTFSNMYAGARYGTNGKLYSKYVDRGTLVEFPMPDGEDPNNLDTYIFGASEISELEDLSLLYCDLINISAASKLTKLVVGNNNPNYRNDILKNLSFSNNRLLKEVNVSNCTGLKNILDFSLCPDIQYIYASGSAISGVQLPDSGFLKVLHLPSTTSNLTLINQHHIEELKCDGYGNLTTIRIENSENVPLQEILLGVDSNVLASVEIRNIDWNADSEANLRTIINKLIACAGSVVEGAVYLPRGTTVSDALKITIHQNFPNLNVIDDNPVFYIDYFNYDNTIWDTETVKAGGNALGPKKGDPDDIIQETQGLRHLFVAWKMLPTNVNKNVQVDATWQTQYAIKFYNGNSYIDTRWSDYGKPAEDPVKNGSMQTPTKTSINNDMRYVFFGWDNLPTSVYKAVSVYAQFDTYWAARFLNGKVVYLTEWIKEGDKPTQPSKYFDDYVNPTCASTAQYDYHFSSWSGDFATAMMAAREFTALYASTIRKYDVHFYNGSTLIKTVHEVPYGSNVQTSDYPSTPTKTGVEDPDEYVFKGWSPAPIEIKGETNCYAFFKFTGYLFGKLGKTAGEDYGYGTVDNPNWETINPYWNTIASDINAYKAGSITADELKTKYPIGGRMLIPINLTEGIAIADVEIIGHDHDNFADGSGKAPLTFFCLDLLSIKHRMNSAMTTEGGWANTEMRQFLNGELFNALPSSLKPIVKLVSKISDGGENNKSLITTSDYCWLASFDEVGFTKSNGNLFGQGNAYNEIFNSDANRIKYVIDEGAAGGWWLRSVSYPDTGSSSLFFYVTKSGGNYGYFPSVDMYIAFGFCI